VKGVIEALGRRALVVQANVAKPEQVEKLFAHVRETFGRVDFLICNAARSGFAPLSSLSLRILDVTMMNNVRSVLACVQAALPLMNPDGSRIIAMTSVTAHRWTPKYGAAAASKTAIESLVRYLAVELAPRRVTVNAVQGGFIETDALAFLPPGWLDEAKARTPLGRLGTPRDIAEMVAFLCSSRAAWITGQELRVDGGFSLT
jgi:enoyl-[acyl-carrier protein] reductase III